MSATPTTPSTTRWEPDMGYVDYHDEISEVHVERDAVRGDVRVEFWASAGWSDKFVNGGVENDAEIALINTLLEAMRPDEP